MLLLFSIFSLGIAGCALFVAFVSLHLWLLATFVTRLADGKYIRAIFWFFIFVLLVHADIKAWG